MTRRDYLTCDAARLSANTLIGSRLDYCNSLFRGFSAFDLRRLQCVQNCLVRIVANTTKYSYITPVTNTLYRLSIKHHAVFKTAVLLYKFLHSGYPNPLNLYSNPNIVCTKIEVNQMACCLMSHTLHQYRDLKAFCPQLMMPQGFGINCVMMYARPNLSLHSGRSGKPISL